jgi:hypothetical protein
MRVIRWMGMVVVAFGVQAGVAWPHPGHGATDPGTPAHYVLEPQHGWWILPVLLGGAALFIRRQIRQSRRQHAADIVPQREQKRQ